MLKAESGIRALEVLGIEGEVAVIISDQRMPEMKGTEFLSKTVPQFPNTVRIILTGFTDIEDLVDAINSGQVYKYITKPWDPNELKMVVQKAAETYEILKQRTEELHRAQNQIQLLATIMQTAADHPNLEATLEPIATAVSDNFLADTCILQMVEGTVLMPAQGTHTSGQIVENWLADDPLAQEAIASGTIQGAVNITGDTALASLPHYQKSGIQAHLSVPVIHANRSIALMSIQWKQPCSLRPDELTTVHLAAQQVALVLTSFQDR